MNLLDSRDVILVEVRGIFINWQDIPAWARNAID